MPWVFGLVSLGCYVILCNSLGKTQPLHSHCTLWLVWEKLSSTHSWLLSLQYELFQDPQNQWFREEQTADTISLYWQLWKTFTMITNADEELIDNPYLGEPTTSRNSAIKFAISQISSQIWFEEFSVKFCDITNYLSRNLRRYLWYRRFHRNFV